MCCARRRQCYGDFMRDRWATGLMVGALAAIALLEIATLGLVLNVIVAFLLVKARGLPALAGMLCGTGAFGLALLAQANARCAAGCSASDAISAVVIGTALLITGVALTLTLYVQGRAGHVSV